MREPEKPFVNSPRKNATHPTNCRKEAFRKGGAKTSSRFDFRKDALVLTLIFAAMRTLFAPAVLAKRLVQPIDNSRMLALEVNVHPLAQVQHDQGKVESSFPLNHMTLVFKPDPSQQAELDTLLKQLHDPSSTNYHKWLTPEQFGSRLGQDDLNRVIGWLQSQEFTIDGVARSKSWISFSGRASHVEATFKTEIHRYSTAGVTNYANVSNPSVPGCDTRHSAKRILLGRRSLDELEH